MSSEADLNVDWAVLPSSSTRLRAAAIAVALSLTGHVVDVTKVARAAGLSRQALHKDHKPVIELIGWLRQNSIAAVPVAGEAERSKVSALQSELNRQRTARLQAERERDKALHHLQLAVATIDALSATRGHLVPLDGHQKR